MSSLIGGHLFIPTSTEFTPLEVFLRSLEILGEPASHSTLFPPQAIWVDQSLAKSIEALQRVGSSRLAGYRVGLSIAGYWSYVELEEVPDYHVLLITSDQGQFREPDPWHDPALVEEFSDRWVATCEALQVLYGYFSHYVSMPTVEHRQTILKRLVHKEIDELVTNAHWRSYLGTPWMARWGEEIERLAQKRIGPIQPSGDTYYVEQRPSRALVLAAGLGYNPCQGDLDLTQHAQFLLRQIEPHQQVPGVAALLEGLREELQGRIGHIETTLRTSNKVNREEVSQSRKYLNDVRGLWASAQEHQGLVGVSQRMAVRRANGQESTVTVPVIAADGQEWLFPLNREPFGSEDGAWNDPTSGVQVQMENLLQTARQHPVNGTPPRVVVLFWNGGSPEIKQALEDMGASVEQPGHRPIFHVQPPEE